MQQYAAECWGGVRGAVGKEQGITINRKYKIGWQKGSKTPKR